MKTTPIATRTRLGFTLVELMVVVSVIGILSAIVYANFGSARAVARDDIRKTTLKDLQVAIQLYKAQNGRYPASCAGTNPMGSGIQPYWSGSETYSGAYPWIKSCPTDYIVGLVPDFISELPHEPGATKQDQGYLYTVNAAGTDYKLLSHHNVEKLLINDFGDDFTRFSSAAECPTKSPYPATEKNVYAVYSKGAGCW